jgi:hypothetical protein
VSSSTKSDGAAAADSDAQRGGVRSENVEQNQTEAGWGFGWGLRRKWVVQLKGMWIEECELDLDIREANGGAGVELWSIRMRHSMDRG